MRSSKHQSRNSSKSTYKTLVQQELPRGSRCEKAKLKATKSLSNDKTDSLLPVHLSCECSQQNFEAKSPCADKSVEGQAISSSSATLDAIQKCMDHTLRAYFIHTIEKIESLSSQLLRNECTFAKMHLDLVERISKLCNQNTTQCCSNQVISERISNQPTEEIIEDEDTGCPCDESDCDCLVSGARPDGVEQSNERSVGSTEQRTSLEEMKNFEDQTCFDCEDKIKRLNMELRSTRDELEECLARLKQINEFERNSISHSIIMEVHGIGYGGGNDEDAARNNQESSENKMCFESENVEKAELNECAGASATKQDIPKPPPQPGSRNLLNCQQKASRGFERRQDYDSEPSNTFTRRQRKSIQDRSCNPEIYERPQNLPNSRCEKSRNSRGQK